MRTVVFVLRFRGVGREVGAGRRRATTTAGSQIHRTTLTATGVETTFEPIAGETATLEADVELIGEQTFVESGRIRYGTAGSLAFRTVGHGVRGPSGIPGRTIGAVLWEVVSGDGCFTGATGFITSNFAVDADGEVVDHHVAQLVVP